MVCLLCAYSIYCSSCFKWYYNVPSPAPCHSRQRYALSILIGEGEGEQLFKKKIEQFIMLTWSSWRPPKITTIKSLQVKLISDYMREAKDFEGNYTILEFHPVHVLSVWYKRERPDLFSLHETSLHPGQLQGSASWNCVQHTR